MALKNMILTFKNAEGKALYEKKLTGLPLTEEAIISKSIEFFNDPEPCMIHRSAVMKRIFFEFSEFLETHAIKQNKTMLPWEMIPDSIKELLDLKGEISEVYIND